MGLDISAHRQLRKQPGYVNADLPGYFSITVNSDFPGRNDYLSGEAVYSAAESLGFRAGSYSGYNRWRDELARLVKYNDARQVWTRAAHGEQPSFVELINFSDCEGTIGPITSAKLARDFAKHQVDAARHPDEYFRETYAEFRRAFEMAADDGCVEFH